MPEHRPPTGQTAALEQLPQLLDMQTLARKLSTSERHLRRLVAERRIPFIKWGHLIRFDPVEIAEWVEAARVPSRT